MNEVPDAREPAQAIVIDSATADTPLMQSAALFVERLRTLKQNNKPDDSTWYGYDIMANVWHLEYLLDGKLAEVFAESDGPIADIGAADGDLGFFLESQGREVDFIDWPATNWNGMRGMRKLHALLDSKARMHEVNLDSQFVLPRERYGLAISLGILYHLKNPYFVLEHLAQHADRLLLSTRIAARTAEGLSIENVPLAYLLDPVECNNDTTNYWIFSRAGLERLLARSGWRIEALRTVGCTTDSEPAHPDRDERAFVYARRANKG